MPPSPPPPSPPTIASLKAWWKYFTTVQKKQPASSPPGAVFGVPLRQSLRYASVQILTANQNNTLYVWGYIPVVVAKCGLFLKENGTEVEGIFRINGSNRRMRELQAMFETPPRYGKNVVWKDLPYTPHDVASIFRRFLTLMPEPIVPHSLYHDFRNVYSNKPFNEEEAVGAYKRLIGKLPLANQYLLLYVLDLLTVFAKKSDKNMMPAANLAVIFRPAVLNHPAHEMSHEHHKLSQDVLEFLIKHQDWFMLDIPPPPRSDSLLNAATGKSSSGTASKSRNPFSLPRGEKPGSSSKTNQGITDELNMYVGPVSDEEDGGWRLAGSVAGSTVGRRRTFSERGSPRLVSDEHGGMAADGRRSAENVTSSSAPTHGSSPFKTATQLTPVREASTADGNAVLNDSNATAAPASSEQTAAATAAAAAATRLTGNRQGTGGSSAESGGGSSGTREKRTKFDDEKLAKNEEARRDTKRDQDRQGRSRTKGSGLWGSVRRSRTVDGTTTSTSSDPKTAPERQVLKKRNSKIDVQMMER